MQPRWYQEEAVQSLFDFFTANAGTLEPKNPLVGLPTGTGKSLAIGEFLRRALMQYGSTRALMATHVKELIEQNGKTLLKAWPDAPLGIYSAGLKRREVNDQLVYGGVQSLVKVIPELGHRDLLLIDEAHLIGNKAGTRYQNLISGLREVNPYLRVIGFSATLYRLGLGHLTNGGIFTDVAYDLTNMQGFNRLLNDGYLCPVVPMKGDVDVDLTGIGLNSEGDFSDSGAQNAFDKYHITFAALKEIVKHGYNRASWMIFAAGIEHAEHIGEMLHAQFGVSNVVVHSKLDPDERDRRLHLFKTGQVRCVINKDILTTGFDHPPLDLIAVLRPTMSTSLWVQMLGRGTRPYDWTNIQQYIMGFNYKKWNCLVLDFAGNTMRLGPINDPVIPKPKKAGKPGDAPIKICPKCPVYNHSSARVCSGCGYEFPGGGEIEPDIATNASEAVLIRTENGTEVELPQYEVFGVTQVMYDTFKSPRTGAIGLKVSYRTSVGRSFHETKWFEPPAKTYAIHKAHDWFRERYGWCDPPSNVWQVVNLSPMFKRPAAIKVWINRPHPEIVGYEW